ncbi:hypothetical protein HPB52_000088 [Rhipicephalus sanguineus]|uniref:Uncharacterized protein n=1 Tax=Rhipicephalus sanguineus TaxID=34632 RepID=A0A9D4PT30_RHISA|nr:hypothetical protein HPB52_000088 [Rhipicephalus sanguineus]
MKKLSLRTGAYSELVIALGKFTAVDDNMLDCHHHEGVGETAESVARHMDWIKKYAQRADDAELRPRLLATAKARQDQIRTVDVTETLETTCNACCSSRLLAV